jgi:hypothetical protein
VGENGSGKSNLIDLLYVGASPMGSYFYIFDLGCELIIKGIEIKDQPNSIITNNKIKKTIFTEQKNIQLDCGNINGDINLNNSNLSFIFYSNMLSDVKNIETKCIIGNTNENKFNISDSYLIDYYIKHDFAMKEKTETHYVSFENQYKLFKNKNIQNTINMIKNVDIKLPIPIPTKVYINIYINDFKEASRKYLNEINLDQLTFLEKVKVNIIANFLDYSLSAYEYKDMLLSKIVIDPITIDDIFASFYAVFSIEHNIDDTHLMQINPYINNFKKAKLFIESIDILKEKIQYEKLALNIVDIDDNFIEMYQQLTLTCVDFFHFEWYPDLSSGQENLLFQFANFYTLTMERFSNKKLKNNIYIFIDEGENTLHPNWQKYYVKYLIEFFSKNFSQKINFIFSSHSPFILSDIPKENVIFLEKDEQTGYCKNVTKETNIETFGANIHSLLSHGFFMKDGLMGEFAKSNINEAITYLNQKTLTEKEKDFCKRIISIIGEPFLQAKLEQMYNEKFGIDDEIGGLQKQQEKINLKIEQLKKLKSENAKS